ncbi:hypothetical protein JCM16303_000921 [Sporobolomyces ruberrimus]
MAPTTDFASRLSKLLQHLGQLPPQTPAHLQHLFIRVQRAKNQAENGEVKKGLELLVRLRGRLQELEEGLVELEMVGSEESSQWAELRREAETAREGLERELKNATSTIASALSSANLNGRHSRSSSVELPRRVPSTNEIVPTPAPPRTDLDAFLSRLEGTQPRSSPSQPSLSDRAHARAKALSDAYSLFLLSTSPSSVLPAGQTLHSIFRKAATSSSSRPSTPSTSISLSQRLSVQAHSAYFDDLSTKLADSTSPTKAREAWNQLCQDLADACLPLIPCRLGQGSIKRQVETLLLEKDNVKSKGAINIAAKGFETIQSLLQVLRQLCAPARDSQVSKLLERSHEEGSRKDLGQLVELVKDVLDLAKDMQEDLERFRNEVKLEMTREDDVLQAVREETGERERKMVREIVSDESEDKATNDDAVIRETTRRWARNESTTHDTETLTKEAVAEALVDALFRDQAIGPPPVPGSTTSSSLSHRMTALTNSVPPILYSTCPRLFELQNQFQALTILACLITIHSSSTSSTSSPRTSSDYIFRLWTILISEIPSLSTKTSSFSSTPTRLAHLSDEIISHLTEQGTSQLGEAEKGKVRSSVDRILKDQDPVFKLLRKRLRDGVKIGVVEALRKRERKLEEGATHGDGRQVPSDLRTGRKTKGMASTGAKASLFSLGKNRRISLREVLSVPHIKGYEALRVQVDETLKEKFVDVWEWMEEVWGDVLEWRELQE